MMFTSDELENAINEIGEEFGSKYTLIFAGHNIYVDALMANSFLICY